MSLAVLVLAMAAHAPPAAATDYPDVLRRADGLYAADKFGEAEPLFRAAIDSDAPFVKRRAYERLMALYVKSGRQDKAIRLSVPYLAWLRGVGDTATPGEVEALLGECYLALGYLDRAEKHLAASLVAEPPMPIEQRLRALRCRAEVAVQARDKVAPSRWAELEALAREAVRTSETTTENGLRVSAIRHLAEALNRRGDTAGALAQLSALPDMLDRLDDAVGRRDVQRQRANLLSASGRYAEAVAPFGDAIAQHRRARPGKRMMVADIESEWATAALAAGRKEEAAELRVEAAADYKAILDSPPTDDPDGGGPLAAFAKLQALTRSARQFAKALDLSRDAAERWSGDALIDARLKSDRGGLELLTSSYQNARKLLNAALADIDAADPPDLRALPLVLVNLATSELACDSRDRADALLDRCLALYRTHGLPDDPVRAECEYLKGVAASQRGDFAAAMRSFRGGLAVCDAVGAAAESVRFNLWLNTALIHKDQGDAESAQQALARAGAALAGFADPDDLSFALIDSVRADLHVSLGQVGPALALVPKIEAVCEKNGVRGGYLWTTSRHVRALDRLVHRDAAGAEAIWNDLAVVQRRDGQLLLARTMNFLGVTAELQGRTGDAVKRFEEAREFQATRPRCGPVTHAITLWRLGALMDRMGKKDEARKLLAEVFDVADKARLNTFGEAAQRAQFFAQFAPAFDLLAKWSVRDGDGEALLRVASRSRSRTLLDQVLAAGVDPRDNLVGPDRERLLAREVEARRKVSQLRARAQLLPPDKPDDPAVKRVVADMDEAQQEYAKAWLEIVNADPMTRVLTDTAYADQSLAKLRRDAVAAQAIILSYVIGRDESYAVLVTGPTAKPEIFRLSVPSALANGVGDAPPGEATAKAGLRGVAIRPIHRQPDRPAVVAGPTVPLTEAVVARLVDQYLRQIADPEFNATRGIALVSRASAKAVVPTVGEALGDAVLPAALRARIQSAGAKRMIVVPDGALHKLPVECLLLSSNGPGPRYALDELPAICYSPSPAVLAVIMARPRRLDGPPSLLTVGDPLYPNEPSPSAMEPPASVSRSAMAFQGSLPRLEGTGMESQRVQEIFHGVGGRVTALLRAQATEGNVVAAMPGQRYIHLAAHGFADDSFGNLFAAIALTPPPPGRASPDDDGFLSLHEIYRLKLTGCELTVLSACITYVGPQRPLEAGVTLAGAFLCAGSRGVLASCWSVDDRATAELMGEFFAAVKPGEAVPGSHADALKAARLKVRAKRGWEAPFYWAPFVFVGPPN